MQPFSTVLSDGSIVVPAQNEANSLYQDGYGVMVPEARLLRLEAFEALHLLERGKISVIDEGSRERLTFQELLNLFSNEEPELWTRYIVYRDLRERGFVVRPDPNSSVSLLAYERGSYGKKPPRYLIYTIWEGMREPITHLMGVLEGAVNDKHILRLAVVDRRGEVVYYTRSEMEFIKKGS